MSITHNKKQIPLLNLLYNYKSVSSAPSNFLLIVFCNSLANSLVDIFSFLTVPPEVSFIKNFKNH